MDLIAAILGGIQVVFGFLLVLFIPGFTLSLVYFPRLTDLQPLERLIYSAVLSIASVMVLMLFMEFVLGVNTTQRNIFLFICLLSGLALVVWHYEKKYLDKTLHIPFTLPLDKVPSWDYHTLLKSSSRLMNAVTDSFGKNHTATVVYHENLTSGTNRVDHSYLLDIGEEIEIRQIIEYNRKVCDCVVLTPPHPKTRYFEIFIRENVEDEVSMVEDLRVYPVLALRKNPGGKIRNFLLNSLSWTITERLYKKAGTTTIQWIYDQDFHISAICRAGDTLDLTVDRVMKRLDEITGSIRDGTPLTSHIESHLKRRKDFLAEMEKHPDIRITRPEVVQSPELQFTDELEEGTCRTLQNEILRDLMTHGITPDTIGSTHWSKATMKIPETIDINKQTVDLAESQNIDDLFE